MNPLAALPFVLMQPILATSGTHWSIFILVIGLALIATLLLFGSAFLRRWLGLSREQSYLLTVATAVAACGYGAYRIYQADELHRRGILLMQDRDAAITAAICAGLFVLFVVPLVAKLYRAWIGAHVSEAEKMPGAAGVRAWLSATNLVFAILVSICAAYAFNYSFLTTFILLLLALLGFPIINTIMQTPAPVSTPREAENLSAEREKVLSMLEVGKITAEESAELLNALAATKSPEPSRSSAMKISPQRRLTFIGAALVLIGFFLPWFSFNPGKEISMTGQMPAVINGMMQNFPGSPNNGARPSAPMGNGSFMFNFQTPSVNITGGEVPHGLGWLVLILSLGVAALPFVTGENLNAHTQRIITLLAFGTGALVLLYLLATYVRFLSAGILLAAAGYVVELASVLKSNLPAEFLPTMRESAES